MITHPAAGMRRRMEGAPWLVCLNAQADYLTAGRPLFAPNALNIAERIAACLRAARKLGWEIVHVRTWRPLGGRGARLTPDASVKGLEPYAGEAVLRKSGFSAFAADSFVDRAERLTPSRIMLAGFGLGHDGLATAFDAVALGWPLTVLVDAVCACGAGACSHDDIQTSALAVLASVVDLAFAGEVFDLG